MQWRWIWREGQWSMEEDAILLAHVNKHNDGNWNSVRKYSILESLAAVRVVACAGLIISILILKRAPSGPMKSALSSNSMQYLATVGLLLLPW